MYWYLNYFICLFQVGARSFFVFQWYCTWFEPWPPQVFPTIPLYRSWLPLHPCKVNNSIAFLFTNQGVMWFVSFLTEYMVTAYKHPKPMYTVLLYKWHFCFVYWMHIPLGIYLGVLHIESSVAWQPPGVITRCTEQLARCDDWEQQSNNNLDPCT